MRSEQMVIDDIRTAIVYVNNEESAGTKGLGVMCAPFIFTCCHCGQDRGIPSNIYASPCFKVHCIHDGKEATFMMYLATSMDFMALAENGIHVSAEGGPTENAGYLFHSESPLPRPIRPSMINFPANQDVATLPGFFFASDGCTEHHVELKVFRDDPAITYESSDIIAGCQGGPIFTEDFHLIGINTNSRKTHKGESLGGGLGKRIDLCCPLLLQRQIQWDTINL